MRTYNKGRVSEFYFEYTDWIKINTFIGLHMFWSNLFLHTAGVEKKYIFLLQQAYFFLEVFSQFNINNVRQQSY